jgi:hypothetical protein
MEQRRETRVDGDQPAWITIYGKVDKRSPGRIRNISGRGMGMEVGEPVGTGSALKIEVGDVMLLGEVIYCRRDGQGYYIGIELDQAVHSLVVLGNSLREFGEPALRTQHAYALHDTEGQDE